VNSNLLIGYPHEIIF